MNTYDSIGLENIQLNLVHFHIQRFWISLCDTQTDERCKSRLVANAITIIL